MVSTRNYGKKIGREYYENYYTQISMRHSKPIEFWLRDGFYFMIGLLWKILFQLTLDFCRGKEVLDIGCGDGRITKEIKNAKFVLGIDWSRKAIRSAKKYQTKRIKFVASSIEEFKPNRKFDIVFLNEVIEHLHSPRETINKIANLLKPNGIVIIFTPNRNNLFQKVREQTGTEVFSITRTYLEPGHINYFNPSEIRNILEMNNFRVVKIIEFPPIWKEHTFVMAKLDSKLCQRHIS